MRLEIKSSGGIAGVQIQGQLDTDELPPELARRAEDVLRAERLRGADSSGSNSMADAEHYDLTLMEDGKVRQFHFQRPDAPDELMALLGDLMHEVILNKMKTREQ